MSLLIDQGLRATLEATPPRQGLSADNRRLLIEVVHQAEMVTSRNQRKGAPEQCPLEAEALEHRGISGGPVGVMPQT